MSKQETLKLLNKISQNTLMQTLDIEYVDFGDDFLVAKMPVTSKVHQPNGILHGGATVALAESVGSAASHLFFDNNEFEIRGIEIAANHVRAIKEGFVFATAKIIHKGRTTQLWEIKVHDEKNKLISLCKLTTIALPRK
ncbi:MAG: hotdog fold thioesterase [Flavobacteriaceae bacterium]|nr:hotdog fold thioesterase [Flavobacteriaceae bacterium]